MVSAPTTQPRNLFETTEIRELTADFVAQLEAHLSARIEAAVERAAMVARSAAKRELAEELNQSLRRLRQCEDTDGVLAVLLDASAPFASRAAVFALSGRTVRGVRVRGVAPAESAVRFADLEFPLETAGAFVNSVESSDPVIAATTASEIGSQNVELFGHPADDRVYLFPLTARQNTVAVLYATGGMQPVEIAPLELLSGAASTVLDALMLSERSVNQKTLAADLVTIQPAEAIPADVRTPDWASLTTVEQQSHLRAQRLARVLVAEMRLYSPDAVRSGRARRDVYGVLTDQIDRARSRFWQTTFPACPSMVDYFHLELVRSLANDDVRLLGPSYPGPLGREAKA